MKNKQRRYSYSYDDVTVRFDIGDIVVTKYGDVDIIVDIKEVDGRTLPRVLFSNINSLCASRISYRSSLSDMIRTVKLRAMRKGFIINSIVKFIQVNDIIVGKITRIYFKKSEYKLYIDVITDDGKKYTTPITNELVLIEHYKTTEDKVRDIISNNTNVFGSINTKDNLVKELVDLIDGRENKIKRIIDDI